MNFLWATIAVRNLDESIAFYTTLTGLRVVRRFSAGPGVEIAFMGNGVKGETLVELLADSNADAVTYGEGFSLGFAVDSLDAMLETVRRQNIPVHRGPVEIPGGARFFLIKDPDGLNVQFFQQA
ncbi:MAG TPA: VOC family protein [Synergistaceae bacterium]|nr:VOC family protein [Synergistaceae bacterium]HPJ25519.1 VOC family protein [Synergistaceae bacterium]HPQ36028.1 VOC family protein [Synergistaceae bacterium]